jgi:hypothetical protein
MSYYGNSAQTATQQAMQRLNNLPKQEGGQAICDTAMGSFVAISTASFVQLLTVVTTCFLTDWSFCKVGWVGELEWSLHQVEIERMHLSYSEHTHVFKDLYTPSQAVIWLSFIAMFMGFGAVGLAFVATFQRNNKMWPFAMMAMGGDMLMRLLALLIYVGIVMPNIKKIKFKELTEALQAAYPDTIPKWHEIFSKLNDWLASGNKCRRQEITLGIRGTMLELGILGFVWMLLFFCGYPCNKRRQEADDEALMQHQQQQGHPNQQQGVELASMQPPVMVAMQPPMGQQSFGVGSPASNQVVGMPGGDFGVGPHSQGYGY